MTFDTAPAALVRAEIAHAADIARAAQRLAVAGVGSPRHDAEALAELAAGDERAYAAYVDRRVAREPLQHITGSAYFRHLELAVGPGVFIPRPETELVAQAAIDFAIAHAPATVVDLCAGSGAIALSIAQEVPTATVHAVEIDAAAMTWLVRNAAGTSVTVHHQDAADALKGLDGTIDVVISNPPYLPLSSKSGMETEVRDHDPGLALWGGLDGLDIIKAVVRRAADLLKPGGLLVIEHDDAHGETLPALLAESGLWQGIRDHEDLTGRPRFATATRTALA